MSVLLQAQNLTYFYGKRLIVDKVDLEFHSGQVVSLLGPNGSGKTTLLKLLLGLLPPHQGMVLFRDRDIRSYRKKELARHMAYVPQVHRDVFSFTVEDVVLMGRMPHHRLGRPSTRDDRLAVTAALERLHISSLKHRVYTELSGGERQLTLIARALAQGAEILIMDEPVNGLDYGNQMRLLRDISRLAHEGMTFIMTTHFPDHAMLTADRVILFKEGTVLGEGPPDCTITKEALNTLYRIEVNVLPLPGEGSLNWVCIPAWAM